MIKIRENPVLYSTLLVAVIIINVASYIVSLFDLERIFYFSVSASIVLIAILALRWSNKVKMAVAPVLFIGLLVFMSNGMDGHEWLGLVVLSSFLVIVLFLLLLIEIKGLTKTVVIFTIVVGVLMLLYVMALFSDGGLERMNNSRYFGKLNGGRLSLSSALARCNKADNFEDQTFGHYCVVGIIDVFDRQRDLTFCNNFKNLMARDKCLSVIEAIPFYGRPASSL